MLEQFPGIMEKKEKQTKQHKEFMFYVLLQKQSFIFYLCCLIFDAQLFVGINKQHNNEAMFVQHNVCFQRIPPVGAVLFS